ncbi:MULTISPECIES: hypothetical protein [Anoxybacillus]|uniref:Uncharacterized protein n=1 Tax=Anoxybacteroides rupiense TaxID=311460 RepID=A0ABD5IU52_9BACL|nr:MULTISPECIES: hypothetical protein [Anoxybacillus]MED5050926.1 hypothetical protein [Anoxybacillus rupiensis]
MSKMLQRWQMRMFVDIALLQSAKRSLLLRKQNQRKASVSI